MQSTTDDGRRPSDVSTPEGLWLSHAEQSAWRRFLYATTLLNDRLSMALESDPEIDLTLGEYEILVRLSEAENKFLRMSELADKVVHSRSRLTHTISRMERRGLVERVRCTNDGRGRQAQLTEAGEQMLERASKNSSDGYPPYNIEQTGPIGLRITLAVAGFTMDDLQITQEDNQLVIRGRQADDGQGRVFLHRGIAKRAFERRFQLADTIKVTGAGYANGLLNIELVREVPEHKKPRKVVIGEPLGSQPVIEGQKLAAE